MTRAMPAPYPFQRRAINPRGPGAAIPSWPGATIQSRSGAMIASGSGVMISSWPGSTGPSPPARRRDRSTEKTAAHRQSQARYQANRRRSPVQTFEQILPIRILLLDKIGLPDTRPFLQARLPANGGLDVGVTFHPNQACQFVTGRENRASSLPMFPCAAGNVVRYTDVKRAQTPVHDDIDVSTFHPGVMVREWLTFGEQYSAGRSHHRRARTVGPVKPGHDGGELGRDVREPGQGVREPGHDRESARPRRERDGPRRERDKRHEAGRNERRPAGDRAP